MQGSIRYKKAISGSDFEDLIPEEHFLKKVNQLVDFSFANKLTEDLYSPNKGRPSISPELYLRIKLIGHLFNIHSNRELIDHIKYNICYRWFCRLALRDTTPHHSSLSRIKNRLGSKILEQFFLEIIEQCKKANLLNGTSVMTDSILLDANASLDSLTLKEKENNDDTSIEKGKRSISNKTHISKTDPDATLAFKSGTPRTLKYKAHVTSDSCNRIILAIKITTGAIHDSVPYLEQLDYVKQTVLGSLSETIADRAYGSGEIISFLRQQTLTTYIPLFSSRSGSSENSVVEGFQYDQENNQYVCPQNVLLKPCKSQGDTTMYISSTKDCKQCSFASSCLAKFKNKGPARYVTRNKYAELYNQIKNEMEQQYFKEKLYERMWKLEGIMNELKNYHDLKRAQYRGLDNTQIQAYFSAMALNIKRLVFFILWKIMWILI
ncbi:transposase DDE domain protein [Legionella pneumophila]|nr:MULTISPECIES: IS1182 family transposase [Legionella]GAN28253.1 transposase DDE domain protein [Legionella pneumophila]HAT8969129.1 IS1182 family transposase [Legionella pneumophila subsp. pneumophila]HAT9867829.1 IS1182 family transposase [Legionella pneumophila subsp. pneumophila]HAU0230597.1 IS1182 family transposase [Legionella pneumophila]